MTTADPPAPAAASQLVESMLARARMVQPRFILAIAMVLSATGRMWLTRGMTFWSDEWIFYVGYRGFDLNAMLQPRVGHLQLVPILVYKGLLEIAGPSSIVFRGVLIGLLLLCAWLFFELVRRRVGDWLALAPTLLLLGFGTAQETVASTVGITPMLTIAAGLGALLCLERRDLRGDIGACVLLVIGVASYAPVFAFIAGAAAAILVVRGPREWRQSWVFVVPIGLYLAWVVWAPPLQGASITVDSIASLPSAVYDALAAALATITGLSRSAMEPPGQVIPLERGYSLIPILLGLTWLLVRERRGRPLDRWIWVFAVMPLVYWMAIGVDASGLRAPNLPRYAFLNAIFLFLFYAQLAAGVRVSPRAALAIVAVLAACLLANLGSLRDYGQQFRADSDQNRAELAAMDLVRGHVNPDLLVEAPGATSANFVDLVITASQYYAAADDYGSPATSIEHVEHSAPFVRNAVDQLLVRALEIAPHAATGPVHIAGKLTPVSASMASVTARGACLRIVPTGPGAVANLGLPSGGFTVRAPASPAPQLSVRRFADAYLPLPPVAPGSREVVAIPPDASTRPWQLSVAGATPATICPLAPAP